MNIIKIILIGLLFFSCGMSITHKGSVKVIVETNICGAYVIEKERALCVRLLEAIVKQLEAKGTGGYPVLK